MLSKVRHEQVYVSGLSEHCDPERKGAYVDVGILDLVVELNKRGMLTTRSCQGNPNPDAPKRVRRDAYIEFANADDAVLLAYVAMGVKAPPAKGGAEMSVTVTITRGGSGGDTDLMGRVTFSALLIEGVLRALNGYDVRPDNEASGGASPRSALGRIDG